MVNTKLMFSLCCLGTFTHTSTHHYMTPPPPLRLCTSLDWDKDGDALAVAQDKNGASASLESIRLHSYALFYYRDPLSLEFPQL